MRAGCERKNGWLGFIAVVVNEWLVADQNPASAKGVADALLLRLDTR